ncbi:MAG: cupin domain-containing protein [Paludibacter sp.]
MKHIVPSPEDQFPETFKSLWLAGPNTGLDSCAILLSRVPPGHKGPRLHVHAVDQFYFILKGRTHVQIGSEVFIAEPGTLVHFPAGVPHCNWNEDDDYEMHLEIMVPPPPPDQLISYHDGEPPVVANAAALFTRVNFSQWNDRPFAIQHLAMRERGSQHIRIYCARVRPGAGVPTLHFHQFDQLYFILDGEFGIDIGLTKMTAGKHSLVVLPAGVVHANTNRSNADEIHLTLLVPEPQPGEQYDYKVEVQYENGPAFTQ